MASQRRNVVAKGMTRFEIAPIAPPQPEWEVISERVTCIIGCNPGQFTLNGTNCWLVGTGKERILIDTGELRTSKKFVEVLERALPAVGCEKISKILITHFHHDHFGGVEAIQERFGPHIPVAKLATPDVFFFTIRNIQARQLLKFVANEHGDPLWSPEIPVNSEEWDSTVDSSWDPLQRTKGELQRDYFYVKRGWDFQLKLQNGDMPFEVLLPGDTVTTEGATMEVFHTPGHCPDHISFFLKEEQSLFSGDHVLGYGTTFVDDLYDYMNTIQLMLSLRPTKLYPGHGPYIEDGVDLLARYSAHRRAREEQAFTVITENFQENLTVNELVNVLYLDTPEEKKWMAKENLNKILRKLEKEGKMKAIVVKDDDTFEDCDFQMGWTRKNIIWKLAPAGKL